MQRKLLVLAGACLLALNVQAETVRKTAKANDDVVVQVGIKEDGSVVLQNPDSTKGNKKNSGKGAGNPHDSNQHPSCSGEKKGHDKHGNYNKHGC